MPMSALVPPMSKVMSRSRAAERADPGAAEHAGGQARQQRERRLLGTIAGVATPPFDAMMRRSAPTPGLRQRALRDGCT